LKIKKLTAVNFKCHEKVELDFEHINTIVGENKLGKTTVSEEIVFCMCGTTMLGSKRCDKYIRKGADYMYVELEIEVPKGTYKIRRTKTFNSVEVLVNGLKSYQKDLEKLMGCDADLFLSVFNPLYLIKLSEGSDKKEKEKARKIIADLITPPARSEILASMSDPAEVEILQESDIYEAAPVRKKNEQLAAEKLKLDGRLEELRKTLASINPPNAQTNTQKDDIKNKLNVLQGKKAQIVAESQASKPYKCTQVVADIKALKGQIVSLRETYKLLQEQIQPLPPKPQEGQKCRTCGQPLPKGKLEKAIETWKENVKKIKKQNMEINAKKEQLAADGKAVNARLKQAKKEHAAATKEYNQKLATWKNKNNNPGEEIKKLDGQIRALLQEYENAVAAAHAAAALTKTKDDIVKIEARIAGIDNDVNYNNLLIRAILHYLETKERLVGEKFASKSKRVSVKMYELIKSTGELRPTFIITYDGIPSSLLSTSERILAGLEISALIRDSCKIKYPVFVDRSEAVTKFDIKVSLKDTQTFFTLPWPDTPLTVQKLTKEDLPAKEEDPKEGAA